MARNLFAKLSLEEAPSVNVNVEVTPEDVVDSVAAADDLNESEQVMTEALVTLEEAEEALGELQEADNAAAAALGEEPADIITGEPVATETPVEGDVPATEPAETSADETTVDPVEVPAENQEVAAAVVQEALRHCYKKLGMDFNRVRVSYESIASQPRAALKLAREEAQEAGKSLWRRVLDWIQNFPTMIMDAMKYLLSFVVETKTTLVRFKDKVKGSGITGGKDLSEGLTKSLSKSLIAAVADSKNKTNSFIDIVEATDDEFKTLVSRFMTINSAGGIDGLHRIEKVETVSVSDDKTISLSLKTLNESEALRVIDIAISKCDRVKEYAATAKKAADNLKKITDAASKNNKEDKETPKKLMDISKSLATATKQLTKLSSELIKFTAKVVRESLAGSEAKSKDDSKDTTEKKEDK